MPAAAALFIVKTRLDSLLLRHFPSEDSKSSTPLRVMSHPVTPCHGGHVSITAVRVSLVAHAWSRRCSHVGCIDSNKSLSRRPGGKAAAQSLKAGAALREIHLG